MPREYHRAYEAKYYARPEVREKRAAQMRAYAKDPVLRRRHEARWILNRAVASGRIKRQPCACGAAKTQAHHHNYAKPLDVKWLCGPCHSDEHAKAEGK